MNYQLTAIFVFFTAFFAMKSAALLAEGHFNWRFLFQSPQFAPKSERRNLKKNTEGILRIWKRFIFISACAIFGIEFYQYLFATFSFGPFIKAWLFSPYIYIFTNLLGISAQCLFLLTREIPSDIHNHPYLSRSISEFWGRRWNLWVSDWLATLSKKASPTNEKRRFLWAFTLSGIFHEVIAALPYYLSTGQNYFGLMTSFFIIQYFAVALDKKVLKSAHPALRASFMWLSIIAPMPLFINPSVTAFFGV